MYICYSDIHALYGGHGGVVVYMYRLGYGYTLILEYVYICYRDVHVVYGGQNSVVVYMHRLQYAYTPIVE